VRPNLCKDAHCFGHALHSEGAEMSPKDLDQLLTLDQTAVALTAAGFPVKSATLATKASRGGGPSFRLFGSEPLYRWGDALDWAHSRMTAPRRPDANENAASFPNAAA
jgi:hypothetical protein